MLCLISLEWIFSSIFLLLYMVTILGLCVVIIAENRNPLKTIPWVVAVLLAPGIGLLFYLFFGQDNRKQRIISRRTYKRIMKRPHTERILQDACNLPPEYQSLATLLRNNNRASLLYGSRLEVFTDGKAKFEALLRDLRGARRYIHIEYYIFTAFLPKFRIEHTEIAEWNVGCNDIEFPMLQLLPVYCFKPSCHGGCFII